MQAAVLTGCMCCLAQRTQWTMFRSLSTSPSLPLVPDRRPERRRESRTVALYNGNLDRNPPTTDLSISSNLGFPPILASTIAKITATAAHFAEVSGSFEALTAVEVLIFWSSIVSTLSELGFLTVTLDIFFMSWGGYRKLIRYSDEPGAGTTGRLCVKASKPYLP